MRTNNLRNLSFGERVFYFGTLCTMLLLSGVRQDSIAQTLQGNVEKSDVAPVQTTLQPRYARGTVDPDMYRHMLYVLKIYAEMEERSGFTYIESIDENDPDRLSSSGRGGHGSLRALCHYREARESQSDLYYVADINKRLIKYGYEYVEQEKDGKWLSEVRRRAGGGGRSLPLKQYPYNDKHARDYQIEEMIADCCRHIRLGFHGGRAVPEHIDVHEWVAITPDYPRWQFERRQLVDDINLQLNKLGWRYVEKYTKGRYTQSRGCWYLCCGINSFIEPRSASPQVVPAVAWPASDYDLGQ